MADIVMANTVMADIGTASGAIGLQEGTEILTCRRLFFTLKRIFLLQTDFFTPNGRVDFEVVH